MTNQDTESDSWKDSTNYEKTLALIIVALEEDQLVHAFDCKTARER